MISISAFELIHINPFPYKFTACSEAIASCIVFCITASWVSSAIFDNPLYKIYHMCVIWVKNIYDNFHKRLMVSKIPPLKIICQIYYDNNHRILNRKHIYLKMGHSVYLARRGRRGFQPEKSGPQGPLLLCRFWFSVFG